VWKSITRTLCLMISVGMAVACIRQALAAEPGRYALVVANSAYEHVAHLPNPGSDGHDMAALLRQLGFGVTEGSDLNREQFSAMVEQFAASLPEAATIVFYYAGHGMQIDGRNYLLAIDTRVGSPDEVIRGGLDAVKLFRQFQGQRRSKVIILDACRNNPWVDRFGKGRGFLMESGQDRQVKVLPGLAQLNGGPNTLIAFSTEPNNVAFDGTGRNSPFTEALLRHLPTPNREIREVLSQVRQQVIEVTDGRQIPWDHSSLIEPVYVVAPPLAAKDMASSGPFGAIAVSSLFGGRIYTGVAARFENLDRAVNSALTQCKSRAPSCSLKEISYGSECIAIATDNVSLGVGWAKGANADATASTAIEQCKVSGGRTCEAVTYCNR
jgi:hypothetical protein